MVALVPAKSFVAAKSRLGEALSPAERQALSQSVLARALESCLGCAAFDDIYLLTPDASGPDWAARYDVELLRDAPNATFDAAIDAALDTVAERGARAVCFVASDLPRVDTESLCQLVADQGEVAVFVAALRDGGTNAFCMPLPRRINLRFGADSALRHVERLAAAGVDARVAAIDALALDLDLPVDLAGLPNRAALGTLSS
jgi:2-phospho-L-lactate guanylyltransferase